jgi:hypothetical protein
VLRDGADVVVKLAGRSVNCRYTEANLRAMLDSHIGSPQAVGAAIASAERPPKVWLQMSTATIYAHRSPRTTSRPASLGSEEPGVPAYWARSVNIAKAWETALEGAKTPRTRKVALRSAIVSVRTRAASST